MPAALFDTNLWIAAVFPSHPLHRTAQQALQEHSGAEPALFCRATQNSFLRLASTPALHRMYGAEGLTNRDALQALQAIQRLPQVSVAEEPPGLFALWVRIAAIERASPKLWMDAYLAAFAITGTWRLVTLDRDFEAFVGQGLALHLPGP